MRFAIRNSGGDRRRQFAMPLRRHRSGIALFNALVGLMLVAMAITLMMQSVAAAVRAERRARERFIAIQWLAGALDELRVTGRVTAPPPRGLREANLITRVHPLSRAKLSSATLVAHWREPSGAPRSATLAGVTANR